MNLEEVVEYRNAPTLVLIKHTESVVDGKCSFISSARKIYHHNPEKLSEFNPDQCYVHNHQNPFVYQSSSSEYTVIFFKTYKIIWVSALTKKNYQTRFILLR